MKKKVKMDEAVTTGYLNERFEEFRQEMRQNTAEIKWAIKEASNQQNEYLEAKWAERMDKLYQRTDPLLNEV